MSRILIFIFITWICMVINLTPAYFSWSHRCNCCYKNIHKLLHVLVFYVTTALSTYLIGICRSHLVSWFQDMNYWTSLSKLQEDMCFFLGNVSLLLSCSGYLMNSLSCHTTPTESQSQFGSYCTWNRLLYYFLLHPGSDYALKVIVIILWINYSRTYSVGSSACKQT